MGVRWSWWWCWSTWGAADLLQHPKLGKVVVVFGCVPAGLEFSYLWAKKHFCTSPQRMEMPTDQPVEMRSINITIDLAVSIDIRGDIL